MPGGVLLEKEVLSYGETNARTGPLFPQLLRRVVVLLARRRGEAQEVVWAEAEALTAQCRGLHAKHERDSQG
jgi:hypothetical protein